FILLWQRPEHYSSAITPGDSGNIVSWLNAHFTESDQFENNHETNSFIHTYDNKLINQVKDFQAKHGLTADGIVGPVTIIHLNTRSGENIPTLIQQS
ncbi:MAG: peptidoglycan-binding protein, partial [Gammaproteobacteria bacterium]|nr:peptidoglycan-binding protein [Gammaproteobacteria bacterium]